MPNLRRDVELLWQVAGMAPKRAFWVVKSVGGFPCVGACTQCGQIFRSQLTPLSKVHEITENLVSQFDQHECECAVMSRKRLS
jgi:hypothetical protein